MTLVVSIHLSNLYVCLSDIPIQTNPPACLHIHLCTCSFVCTLRCAADDCGLHDWPTIVSLILSSTRSRQLLLHTTTLNYNSNWNNFACSPCLCHIHTLYTKLVSIALYDINMIYLKLHTISLGTTMPPIPPITIVYLPTILYFSWSCSSLRLLYIFNAEATNIEPYYPPPVSHCQMSTVYLQR